MKISELTKSSAINRAMEIPVAISGENRSLTLGQIIDALTAAIVPFASIDTTTTNPVMALGSTALTLPIVYYQGAFYARQTKLQIISGLIHRDVTLYTKFSGSDNFYDDAGKVRTDCLFIAGDGRLYRHTGTALISAGLTDAQAEQIKLLTPIPVESEDALAALETAGEIVPGQIYYIPEND